MATFNGFNIIPLPTSPAAPRTIDWGLQDIVGVSESPFTGQQQIQDWQNSYLAPTITYAPLSRQQGPPFFAFLAALRGQGNIFQIGDPLNTGPQAGIGSGTMTIGAANQSGYSLVVNGYTGVLTAGDWLQIGYRLYLNLTTQSIGGSATLSVWPNLREPPTDGAAIVLQNTQGLFRLKANGRKISMTEAQLYGVSFEAREAI